MLNSTEITFLENETWSNSLKIDNESQIVLFLKSPFFPLLKNKQKKKTQPVWGYEQKFVLRKESFLLECLPDFSALHFNNR